MKKLIIIVTIIAAIIVAYFLGKTPKNSPSSTASNQLDSVDTTQDSNTNTTNSNNAGNNPKKSSSSNTQGNDSGTNLDVVDTSKFYDYWSVKGEYIYLRKGGKTAVGNYAVGFLRDGRIVYTNYQNEGTPEEIMQYSLSPEYLLVY